VKNMGLMNDSCGLPRTSFHFIPFERPVDQGDGGGVGVLHAILSLSHTFTQIGLVTFEEKNSFQLRICRTRPLEYVNGRREGATEGDPFNISFAHKF